MLFFFFNDTATTEIYTLSLHDALPILNVVLGPLLVGTLHASLSVNVSAQGPLPDFTQRKRSEEHTSELQSRQYLVCRLLLEKKKKKLSILSLLFSLTLSTHSDFFLFSD